MPFYIAPRRRRGFTLVELLVVIAIIAVLIAILLPALTKAKLAGQRTMCMSQMRQLTIACRMYSDENKGYLVMGWPDASRAPANQFYPWFLGANFPGGGNTELAVKNGSIYKFNKSLKIYKCPGDTGLRKVSYGINCYLNGEDNFGGSVLKMSKVKKHTNTFVFIDEYDYRGGDITGYNLGSFGILPEPSNTWVDYPGMFHGYASAVSFLDGHADVIVWDLISTRYFATNSITVTDPKDIRKLQKIRGGPPQD